MTEEKAKTAKEAARINTQEFKENLRIAIIRAKMDKTKSEELGRQIQKVGKLGGLDKENLESLKARKLILDAELSNRDRVLENVEKLGSTFDELTTKTESEKEVIEAITNATKDGVISLEEQAIITARMDRILQEGLSTKKDEVIAAKNNLDTSRIQLQTDKDRINANLENYKLILRQEEAHQAMLATMKESLKTIDRINSASLRTSESRLTRGKTTRHFGMMQGTPLSRRQEATREILDARDDIDLTSLANRRREQEGFRAGRGRAEAVFETIQTQRGRQKGAGALSLAAGTVGGDIDTLIKHIEKMTEELTTTNERGLSTVDVTPFGRSSTASPLERANSRSER